MATQMAFIMYKLVMLVGSLSTQGQNAFAATNNSTQIVVAFPHN